MFMPFAVPTQLAHTIIDMPKKIETDTKLKMKWKFKEWPEYADVVIEFVSFNDSCEVKVNYTNIPSHD